MTERNKAELFFICFTLKTEEAWACLNPDRKKLIKWEELFVDTEARLNYDTACFTIRPEVTP